MSLEYRKLRCDDTNEEFSVSLGYNLHALNHMISQLKITPADDVNLNILVYDLENLKDALTPEYPKSPKPPKYSEDWHMSEQEKEIIISEQEREIIRLQGLIGRYINMLESEEGSNFLSWSNFHGITEDEVEELEEHARAAR